ncbi:MAG: hypothetical protein ACO1RT_13855 [Planctomycetaceae bacterium]
MKYLFFHALAATVLATGCNRDGTQSGNSDAPLVMDSATPATVDVHEHASEGPHHGTLIELGNEEYHAELVHDDQSVTIYILDGTATKSVPIDATDVAINLVHDGKPSQFKLEASPDASDPAGKCSRFALQNAELVEALKHDDAAARLSVLIGGKAYRGDIHHDHAGHDHAEHDHAGHDHAEHDHAEHDDDHAK